MLTRTADRPQNLEIDYETKQAIGRINRISSEIAISLAALQNQTLKRRGKEAVESSRLTPTNLIDDLIAWAKGGNIQPEVVTDAIENGDLSKEDAQHARELIKTSIGLIKKIADVVKSGVETKNKNEEFRLEQAKFNQELSLFFLTFGGDASQPEYFICQLITSLFSDLGTRTDGDPKTADKLLPFEKESLALTNLVNGARAQAALCRALQDQGYFVILPDTSSNHEMREWDLKGIDFIAIGPSGLVKIDAKSRGSVADVEVIPREFDKSAVLDVINYLSEDKIAQLESSNLYSKEQIVNIKNFAENADNNLPLESLVSSFEVAVSVRHGNVSSGGVLSESSKTKLYIDLNKKTGVRNAA